MAEQFAPWLSGEAGVEYLKPALNDYLQRWLVSKRVNSSKADADDAAPIDKIRIGSRMGMQEWIGMDVLRSLSLQSTDPNWYSLAEREIVHYLSGLGASLQNLQVLVI